MDLSVLRRSDDSLETTELPAKEPKLSYSIASLLQTVQRAKAVPALEREEKTEESDEDEEDEISVDSSPDTSEDDRLAVKVTEEDEEEPEDHQNPSLLDLRLGVPPHLLRPGLPLPLQGLLPPGWPGLALLNHQQAVNNQHRHQPGNTPHHTTPPTARSWEGNKCGAIKSVK